MVRGLDQRLTIVQPLDLLDLSYRRPKLDLVEGCRPRHAPRNQHRRPLTRVADARNCWARYPAWPWEDSSLVNLNSTIERTLAYHQRTKHHLRQYARSPGYLDWATQPDPFRTYAGATRIELELLGNQVTSSYGELFRPGAIPPRSIDVDSIGVLFELSLGLSAWKEYQGSRWALRCNPSSGNLHPTEGYLIAAGCAGSDGRRLPLRQPRPLPRTPLFAESRGDCSSDRSPSPA